MGPAWRRRARCSFDRGVAENSSIVSKPPSLSSILKAEPGLRELLRLAVLVTPAGRPRRAAWPFYRAAARKLVGPGARNFKLRSVEAERLYLSRLERALGVDG